MRRMHGTAKGRGSTQQLTPTAPITALSLYAAARPTLDPAADLVTSSHLSDKFRLYRREEYVSQDEIVDSND
ncbi:hypothetical protein VTN96DRAFT_6966 [Rasamsonia emersonii]